MPAVSKYAFIDLGLDFERYKNLRGTIEILCKPCQERFLPSSYERHCRTARHQTATAPPVHLLLLPAKRPRSPSPPPVPPPRTKTQKRDSRHDDFGGFDGADSGNYEERALVRQIEYKLPSAPVLHQSLEERVLTQPSTNDSSLPSDVDLEAACREIEMELGLVVGDDISQDEIARLEALANEIVSCLQDDGDYAPFKNAAEFALYAMVHMPSAPLSQTAIRLHCLLLKVAKTPSAPNYPSFLKVMKAMKELSNEPDLKECTGGGYPYHHKSIPAAFERDLNNPRLAANVKPYPRRHSGWKELHDGTVFGEEVDSNLLTPMIRIGSRDLYVFEPVVLCDGTFFLPTKWFVVENEFACEGSRLRLEGDTLIEEVEIEEVSVQEFDLSDPAFARVSLLRLLNVDREEVVKVNPLRAVARGKRFLSIPAALYADDYSGAEKSVDTHYSIQVTNAALPRSNRSEPAGVRLWSTSKVVEPLDLLSGLRDHLLDSFENPRFVYDAHLKEIVALRIYPLLCLGDTAMSDRFSSHMGSAALCNCRACHVKSDSKQARRTPEGFVSYLTIQATRQANETIDALERQLDLAEQNKATQMEELATSTGIKDKITSEIAKNLLQYNDELRGKAKLGPNKGKRKETEAVTKNRLRALRVGFEERDWHNPLLGLYRLPFKFNVHERTPQDVLHVYNIGPLAFLAKQTAATLTMEARDQLQVRLEDFDTSGLSSAKTLPAAALIKNMASLVGRERIWLAQSMAVALAPLVKGKFVSQELQTAWKCIGEYGRECYTEEVTEKDKKRYSEDMTNGLGQVIESFAEIDPSSLTSAYKFHGCAHLNFDIPRYGVPASTSCERHENKNGRLKLDSIHSNRSAPSFDIATREATQEWFAHILDGGYYKTKEGEYRRAGAGILGLVSRSVLFRKTFNLGDTIKPYTSAPTLSDPRTDNPSRLSSFQTSRFDVTENYKEGVQFSKATTQHDLFSVGNFASVSLEPNDDADYGFASRNRAEKDSTIVEIISFFQASTGGPEVLSKPFVLAQRLSDRHELARYYGMPSLKLEPEFGIFPLKSLVCRLSVVHDCVYGNCKIDESGKTIRVERQDVGLTKPSIACNATKRYVLNTTLFRSSHFARSVYKPIPKASSLRDIGNRLYG